MVVSAYEAKTVEFVQQSAEEGHILFGSDFPFIRDGGVARQLDVVRCWDEGRDKGEQGEVERKAAKVGESLRFGAVQRLFPRFANT